MKIIYYGHSCFSIITGNKTLLFDPFISGNELAQHISIEDVEADYIFVSHGQFDHMLDVVEIATRTGALVVCNWELHSYFSGQGLSCRPLNPGGQLHLDFGTVKAFMAQNTSSFIDGDYTGSASGFAFKTTDGNFYYSGDSALSFDMILVSKWAEINFAVFPIGDVLTMGADDAVEAAKFVKTNIVIGVHFDTFGFIQIDKEKTIDIFEKSGITVYIPEVGTCFQF